MKPPPPPAPTEGEESATHDHPHLRVAARVTAPTDAESIRVTGRIVFAARLSPSFALFSIDPGEEHSGPDARADCPGYVSGDRDRPFTIDVAVTRGSTRDPVMAAEIWREVEARMTEGAKNDNDPVVVHGWYPMEPFPCRPGCGRKMLRCWTIDGLLVPEVETEAGTDATPETSPPLCREITDPPAAAATDPPRRKRRGDAGKKLRASRFADALIGAVGLDALRAAPHGGGKEKGVLDVAGGSGGLTFELSLRRSVPSTVIDPRPVKLNAAQRRTLDYRRKSRDLLRPGLHLSHAARRLHGRFGEWEADQVRALFGEGFAESEKGGKMLRDCTVVVGMHPDEATDPIIDLAMRHGKPWAVVPCCVFPNAFKRTLRDGTPVRKYEELCQYIKDISEDVREVELDFEGRNKMYYWIPP